MDLTSAIKSGRKIRGKGSNGPYFDPRLSEFSYIDLISEDWETEEEKKEISLRQLKDAWDHALGPYLNQSEGFMTSGYSKTFSDIAIRLGFNVSPSTSPEKESSTSI